jgi:hypothetical protein
LVVFSGVRELPIPQVAAVRFTQVWARRDGRWLREAFQATLVDPLAPQIAAPLNRQTTP